MSSSPSAVAGAKPWKSWPLELPSVEECRNTLEFHRLFDEQRIREMHQEIRANIFAAAKAKLPATPNSVILLAGGTEADFELYDTDVLKTEFRQEAFFRYVFGVNEPDCFGALDLSTGESLLFIPPVSDDSERWNGTRRPFDYHTARYGVSATYSTEELHKMLLSRGVKNLFTLYGLNLDSGNHTRTIPKFQGMESYTNDNTALYPVLSELRVFKTPKEVEVLRLANLISSQAHVYVMRHIRPGMSEMQLEALYKAWCAFHGGSRHCAYTCICGSGENGSILHYGHAGRANERILKDGDTCVLDLGAEFVGYATDITRSYPVNGKFTPDQKIVHDAVYEAQQAVIRDMKPGVEWPKMHRLAEKVIVTHLLKAGLLQGGSVDELCAANLGAVFMPHGLGHLLGMSVHDVGGYLPGSSKSAEPGLCWLRCGRKLEPGMFITVEPGVYFNDPTLDKALANPAQAKYINVNVLKRFRGTGGCRLEDDVLVTENGCENLTILPTSTEDIEEVVQEAAQNRN
jgi:Xaa-Pro dipeptidase